MIVKLLKKGVFYAFLIFFISCSNEASYKENIAIDTVAIDENFEAVNHNDQSEINNESINVTPKNLKIIKIAKVKYKVKDVKKTTKLIKKIAITHNAYISDLRFENNPHKKQNRFTIKVPQANFDIVLDSINSFVEFVDYENITTEDVTEEYLDLQSRLKTKLEVKERYEIILRKKAKSVEEILLTEEKLRILQEEIEAAQGKLTYISHKVAYSTIQIDLYETVTYKEEPITYKKTLGNKIKGAFSFGYKLIETIFIGIIYLWPLLIITFLIFLYYRNRRKKT